MTVSQAPPAPDTELELALDRFAAFAAHQLGEGVRIVTGWTEALEEESEGRLDRDAQQALQAISGGGVRLQRFVDDLLHLTALTREGPARQELDIAEPLSAALGELEPQLELARARVDDEQAHGMVVGDRRRLELMFEHLLRGALAASPVGAPRIQVAAHGDGDWLTVQFSDNGLSLTEAEAEAAFEPLAPPRGRGALLGAGVGPLICRRVVDGHGGRIWATPRPGASGITVHVTLPGPGAQQPAVLATAGNTS